MVSRLDQETLLKRVSPIVLTSVLCSVCCADTCAGSSGDHLLFLRSRHHWVYLEHWELLGVRSPCFLD